VVGGEEERARCLRGKRLAIKVYSFKNRIETDQPEHGLQLKTSFTDNVELQEFQSQLKFSRIILVLVLRKQCQLPQVALG
jgi:hypothetical protein